MSRYLAMCFVALSCCLSPLGFASLPDFSDLIESSSPAVVKINVAANPKTSRGRNQSPNAQELPEIFRHFFDPRMFEEQRRPSRSLGSGFFISDDGYVITNNHVIEGADEITVELVDRRQYSAEVIGADPRSDLALLKIEEKDLPFLKLAKDATLRVGEWVVAIGSPFGLEFSASAGIVSAKGRSIRNQSGEDYVPFIQTDVAINPGNSGGPLFNLEGEVVGVNSQIYSSSGGSIGLSFAIPASVVENVVGQLKSKGTVDRGWLGVVIQDIDKNLAESFGLDRPRGALINQMIEGGPADEGGLKVGDVILSFNGYPVNSSSDLPHVVGATEPGKKVKVEVIRGGKDKTIRLEVGVLDKGRAQARGKASKGSTGNRLGLVVEAAPDRVVAELDIDGGVIVSSVEPDSPAFRAGIRQGDIILDINFQKVKGVSQFEKTVRKLPKGKPLPIRFVTDGRAVYSSIKIE